MEYIEDNNKIILKNANSFNIQQILECGQCFRFEKNDDLFYTIIAYKKVLHIKQNDNSIVFYPCTLRQFEDIWIDYFDLNTDYEKIKNKLKTDPILNKAIQYAPGIRLLNQEPFECLISFIISQNNRIPMIKQVIKNICKEYGDFYEGSYLFPSLEQLKNVTEDELKACKTGFRAKYILDAIEKINNKTICFDKYKTLSSENTKNELLLIKGVGTKVADCVMLFCLKKFDVFPTDVWVKRVMEHFYFNKKSVPIKNIHNFAKEKWGNLAGYAQQYLFYYARSQKIGTS